MRGLFAILLATILVKVVASTEDACDKTDSQCQEIFTNNGILLEGCYQVYSGATQELTAEARSCRAICGHGLDLKMRVQCRFYKKDFNSCIGRLIMLKSFIIFLFQLFCLL